MTKLMGVVVAMMLLALPSAALAAHGKNRVRGYGSGPAVLAALQQCNQERTQAGKPAFQQKYGEHAFRSSSGHLAADRAAAQACRGERKAMGVPAFRQKYGTPNALVRCIRSKTG